MQHSLWSHMMRTNNERAYNMDPVTMRVSHGCTVHASARDIHTLSDHFKVLGMRTKTGRTGPALGRSPALGPTRYSLTSPGPHGVLGRFGPTEEEEGAKEKALFDKYT